MRIILGALAMLCLLTACDGNRPEGGWWHYGFSGSSPFWHEVHKYDEDPTQDQRLVVVITAFADEKTAVHHILEADGSGMSERDGAKTPFRRGPQQVAAVREQLGGLTPGGSYPPAEHLVIVRWHQGGMWAVARYDRTELPPVVQELARLVSGAAIGDIAP